MRPSNVFVLAVFISTAEKKNYFGSVFSVIDSVSRAKINFELRHAMSHRAMIAKVSLKLNAVQPSTNYGSTFSIS